MNEQIKILVLNGPNINMLGIREPEIYGAKKYSDLVAMLEEFAVQQNIQVVCRQSNHEGVLVDWIQESYGNFAGIVINPAAYTHYSIAILDALKAVGVPTIEVHISDISKREAFRQVSYPAMACLEQVCGHGFDGYTIAIEKLLRYLKGGKGV